MQLDFGITNHLIPNKTILRHFKKLYNSILHIWKLLCNINTTFYFPDGVFDNSLPEVIISIQNSESGKQEQSGISRIFGLPFYLLKYQKAFIFSGLNRILHPLNGVREIAGVRKIQQLFSF